MGPPTLIVYRSIRNESKANRQDWDAVTLSPVEIKDNWWTAAIAFSGNVFPGYTYKWRFYAWSKYENGRIRINEDSESFWSYEMGTSTLIYGYWPASRQFNSGDAIYIAGYANEKWQWWFDIDMSTLQAKQYTLTFVNYTGQANNTVTVYYDNIITVTAGTRPGYNFVKYTSNFGDIYNGGRFTWNRASDETLTSVWEIISYTVTFNSTTNGITTNRYVTVNYGSSVSFPTFKAVGYTFLRWVNAYNTTYSSISFLSDNITLYAVWQEKNNINFTELNRVYNGTRGSDPINRGVNSISIGKFRAESGQTGTNQIKLITHFKGKG